MKKTKLAKSLQSNETSANKDGRVDVVIQVAKPSKALRRSVGEAKASFHERAKPLVEKINQSGGDVTGVAWINQTLRASVPDSLLDELTDSEDVEFIDIPHAITAE